MTDSSREPSSPANAPRHLHASDCAIHNEPAYRASSCDCGTDAPRVPEGKYQVGQRILVEAIVKEVIAVPSNWPVRIILDTGASETIDCGGCVHYSAIHPASPAPPAPASERTPCNLDCAYLHSRDPKDCHCGLIEWLEALPSERTCATCHAILADGPQPACTYEPATSRNAALEEAAQAVDRIENWVGDWFAIARRIQAAIRALKTPTAD